MRLTNLQFHGTLRPPVRGLQVPICASSQTAQAMDDQTAAELYRKEVIHELF
jgi:hypothetical protein